MALTLRNRMFGATNPATRAVRQHLNELHRSIGDAPGAVQLLAAEFDVAAPGGRVINLDGASVASRLADALYDCGDLNAANDLSTRAVLAIEQVDPYSPALVEALIVSARFAAASGDVASAEAKLEQAMKSADRTGSLDKMNAVRKAQVDIYIKAGRFDDAVPLSATLLRTGSSSQKSPDMLETARMNRQHADLLDRAGRTDDAAKHRRLADTLERLTTRAPEPKASAT